MNKILILVGMTMMLSVSSANASILMSKLVGYAVLAPPAEAGKSKGFIIGCTTQNPTGRVS